MADAQDLKSCDPNRSYRFDPGLRHQKRISDVKASHCRGVEQLVARRAHNPEAAGSNPVPATKKSDRPKRDGFFYYGAYKPRRSLMIEMQKPTICLFLLKIVGAQ